MAFPDNSVQQLWHPLSRSVRLPLWPQVLRPSTYGVSGARLCATALALCSSFVMGCSHPDEAARQPAAAADTSTAPTDTTTADVNASGNALSASAATKTTAATAGTGSVEQTPAKPALKIATHARQHHGKRHHVARNSRSRHTVAKHSHSRNRKAARRSTASTSDIVALIVPDHSVEMSRDQFRQDMANKVAVMKAEIGNYHNPAPITDSLTPYMKRVQNIHIAEQKVIERMNAINQVPDENWNNFAQDFRHDVSQLELDYAKINQASR